MENVEVFVCNSQGFDLKVQLLPDTLAGDLIICLPFSWTNDGSSVDLQVGRYCALDV